MQSVSKRNKRLELEWEGVNVLQQPLLRYQLAMVRPGCPNAKDRGTWIPKIWDEVEIQVLR